MAFAAQPLRATGADALLLSAAAGGGRRSGSVTSCDDERCQLDRQAVPLAELIWIGLGVGSEPPPEGVTVRGVVLADGSFRPGRLVGLSLGSVLLDVGGLDRGLVRWVRVTDAPPEPAPDDGPVYRPSPPATPGPPQGPPPPQAAPPAERPPADPAPPAPPASPPGGSGERGALWTGTLTARAYGTVDDTYSEWNVTVDVRLREYSIPMSCWNPATRQAPRVGTLIRLLPEGSVVTNSFRCSGPHVSCSGGGSVTVSVGEGDDGIGQPAAIFLKTSDVDTSECVGLDPTVGGGQYFLGVGTRSSDTFPVTWVSSSGTSTELSGFLSLVAGWSPLLPVTACADRETRAVEGGGVLRGSYTGPCTGCCPTIAASWSVCREGVACPPPPPLPAGGPPDADPCGDLARDRALVDVLWDQRQAYAADLATEWRALEQAQAAMLDDVEAYRAAIDACAIWDIVGEALESWGDWGGEFPEFVTKVLSGDLSAFVGDDIWGPLSERAWDAFPPESTWAGNMHDRISGCGAPLPADLRAAAHRFVDSWERVRGLMPSVQEKLNRIQGQDLRYWEEWHRFYQTCLEWAACKGVPSTECPRPPEQPSGPMPPAPPGAE